MSTVTWSRLQEESGRLLAFAAATEEDIHQLWRRPGEEMVDLTTLVYSFDIPLSQKMVWRFRQNRGRLSGLYQGVDPANRAYLRRHYGVSEDQILFLAWLTHGLGRHDIAQYDHTLVPRWENQVDAVWFFSLSEKLQQDLVDRYNQL